jgi:predicted ArsR family transcriptional regulator
MYREVTMIEVREVLRLQGEGLPKKRIAAQLGLDPKTVRRHLEAAATVGVTRKRSSSPLIHSRRASRRRSSSTPRPATFTSMPPECACPRQKPRRTRGTRCAR